ncbi:formimidoylglutamase [Pedobacter deserti]|uniref:formimidoylglutamase n=1 Tax=Pedobacter deserti TaxID=2817382 RepID=UPI00210CB391|nr:formimidoylglutamase [Pedobacter sp. SYSU D00382]
MEKRKQVMPFYEPADGRLWQGRVDGDTWESRRWHQCVELFNVLVHPDKEVAMPALLAGQKGFAFIGFCCDEGVVRNQGRPGAGFAPGQLRKACASLPVHFEQGIRLVDLGDIVCRDHDLEGAQLALGILVESAVTRGFCPIVLGGGHEVVYGHYIGFTALAQKIGIINFDAHFDLRIPAAAGPSSGTGFWQIAEDCKASGRSFHYLPIGIQQHANTRELYNIAAQMGVKPIHANEFIPANETGIIQAINEFIEVTDHVYLTIDLDVFAAAYAPGVSAVGPTGLIPDAFFERVLAHVIQQGKVISFDIAELNPTYDIDNRTAKLGAWLIFNLVSLHPNR